MTLFEKKHALILSLALVAAGLALLMLLYFIQGPAWDMITHYLNAKGFVSHFFLSKSYAIHGSLTIQSGTTYIEIFRDALSPAIFLPLVLLFSNPILPYLVIVYALFVIAVCVMSRHLKLDYLIALSLFINPYFIVLSLFANSEEILSLIFMLIALGLLYKKHPIAGLFIGVAGLGKETALVFLPMLFFLGGKRNILFGFALFAAITIPWLLFNAYFFGGPFASYIDALNINILASAPVSLPLLPFLGAAAYPLAILGFGLILLGRKRAAGAIASLRKLTFFHILIAFLVLSVIASTAISLRKGQFDQLRYGYLITVAVCLISAAILSHVARDKKLIKRIALAALSVTIAFSVCYVFLFAPGTSARAYNANSSGSVLSQSKAALSSLGYGDCRVVSNAWVYLLYVGAGAYSPYSYNQSVSSYPIVTFANGFGVPLSAIENLNTSKSIYKGGNFSILLPKGSTCVPSS